MRCILNISTTQPLPRYHLYLPYINSLSLWSATKMNTLCPSSSISLHYFCAAMSSVSDASMMPFPSISSLSLVVSPRTSHQLTFHYTASRRAQTRLQSLRLGQRAANRFLQTIYLMAIFSWPIRQPSSPSAINTCWAPPDHISGFQAPRENTDAPSPPS